MFAIKEKTRVLPDGTKITTFTREVSSANTLEVEVGTNGFKGGNASCGARTATQPNLNFILVATASLRPCSGL